MTTDPSAPRQSGNITNPRAAQPHDQPTIDATPFIEAQADAQDGYGRFNLGIIGGTGVGKSSLVNAVFGRNFAKVGVGLPVTEGVNYYHDGALGIWDFEGFEIGTSQHPAESLRAHLNTISQRPANEQIAVVWYCIASTADRLTRPDIDMIRELDASGLPVILVLTKVDWQRNPVTGKYSPPAGVAHFRDWLEDPHDGEMPIAIPYQRVMLTSAFGTLSTGRNTQGKDRSKAKRNDRGEVTGQADQATAATKSAASGTHGKGAGHGLGDLVLETLALSPERAKDAFRIAQRLNLPWKKQMARKVVARGSALAAAAAAVPIPVADATALAPIQLTMMGRIAAIYELDLTTMMSTSAIAQLGTQMAGQALARSFIKFIPGAGSVISAGVASALTAATGEAWIRLCEQVHTGKVNQQNIEQMMGDFAPRLLPSIMQAFGKGRK